MKYVNLVIDNKSDNTDTLFTYGCEFDHVKVGDKVYVPFNRSNKIKEGYVFQVLDKLENDISGLKYVKSIDEDVYLSKEQIETCIWMKKRYFCRYIDCVKLFLPSGKKPIRREVTEVIDEFEGEIQDIENLTDEQKIAVEKISDSIINEKRKIFLLEGVTGSGKTEVYMRAAKSSIENGKNAIMLVPEVSLTKQITDRFISRFGKNKVAIIHSKMSPSERYDQWQKIRKGHACIIIGARSAVFAPLENIGVIILDEEHEATYKSDMTPKYETVEVAVKRASAYGGSVILGSATPSVVSKYRAQKGIYEILQLKNRYNNMMLPKVDIVDMRAELKDGNRSIFSKKLYDEIRKSLEEQNQIILMINKRGYSTFVSCRNCGYVVKCDKCGIAMTYHKDKDALVCHYCGRKAKIPKSCPKCNSPYIKHFGAGTEKVFEEVTKYFPKAKVAKVDFDTSKKKGEINRILSNFGKGKIDILVGTQIIGKSIDYKNVALVGIIAADSMLNIADYRSAEKTFQLITQAAGRTGRGDRRGMVVVQSYLPDEFPIVTGAKQDNEEFFRREIRLREIKGYPPFGALAQITIMGKSLKDVKDTSYLWKQNIRQLLGNNVFIGEKSSFYDKDNRVAYLIKFDENKKRLFMGMVEKTKEKLRLEKNKCSSIIDINPYSTWRS